ncbi:MAG: radical SAM protein [Phycisphaerae bacterium]|nr:radical SAM protein [Phycisphaerae bacterium]
MFDLPRMFAGFVGRVPMGHLLFLAKRMRNERPIRFNGRTRVNSFFPPFPSPAFDRFRRAVIKRKRVPYNAYLAVTSRCPYHCSHCSLAGRSGEELTTEQWLSVIEQLQELGACTVGFTGGEPMLRDDLAELIRAAGRDMATILFTTGYNLATTEARAFREAGLGCVTVGVESSDPREHNTIRAGEGDSFASASIAIAACQQEGLFTALSTIGTKERIHSGELERMYEMAREWHVGEFRLLAPVATGGKVGCSEFMLSDEEYAALAEFHIRHNREKTSWSRRPKPPAVASFAYLESTEMFGCGAGYHHLFIDAAGNVCPCDLTPLSFGNVLHEPLANIWRRMGESFPRPRRKCIMRTLAGQLTDQPLPIEPDQSAELIPPPDPTEPLPEGYRRLL